MNIPYSHKQHGELKGNYLNQFSNRRTRRLEMGITKQTPFIGNVKHISLTVSDKMKYIRYVQKAIDKKTGEIKYINHYLLA